jgi:hypothetical protein
MDPRPPFDAIAAWLAAFPGDEIAHWVGRAAVQWPLVSLPILALIVAVAVRDVRRLRAADAAERALRPR